VKKLFASVLFVVAIGTAAYAQDSGRAWYNSYAEGIDQKLLLNAGIGLGPTGGYDLGMPPISVSIDYKLPIKLPITVGGIFTFARWKYSYSIPFSNLDYDFAWNNIGLGARGMYHFNFVKNLDTYAGLTLGYVIQTFDGGDYTGNLYEGVSFFLFGANVGVRYFFTKAIGAYLEAGYSGLQFVSLGLTLKFL
jgi:hypothetical protein